MDFKDLRHKTWIDWVKVFVALDIAFVGFGLILDQEIHIFSHIFGFLTRIPFGVMYIFIAVLILKRVFPNALHIDPKDQMDFENIDEGVEKGVVHSKSILSRFIKRMNKFFDALIVWVDGILDRIASFFEKRHGEVKKELNTIIKENEDIAHKESKIKDDKKSS